MAVLSRRSALVGFGALGAILAVPALGALRESTALTLKPWSDPDPGEKDVRIRALSYAVLAPNAHNTQPWSLALRGKDQILLYVDRTRLLPATDPHFRQTHVSQGTFLELLAIAFSALGRSATVTLFPEGEYSNATIEDVPVARVDVSSGHTVVDGLFEQILQRRSNKRAYAPDRKLTPAQIESLKLSAGEGTALSILDGAPARERLAEICATGMAVEVAGRERNVETARWFRFSTGELIEKRDGFGLAHNGKSGVERWVAEEFVLSREKSADPGGVFAKGAVDMAREQARSAAAFGVLSTKENSRRAQVLAGRCYARTALTAQALGLAMHPMSQALEEYPEMATTKARLAREVGVAPSGTVQMLFRLGHAKETPHTPRRDVREMLRRSGG